MKRFKVYLTFLIMSVVAMSCILSFDDYGSGYDSYGYWEDSDTNIVVIDDEGGEVVTNDNYYTNTVVYTLDVDLLSPVQGGYYYDSIAVEGEVLNGAELQGALIYVESTNGAIVSADYSTIEGTSFSAGITVSREGYYYIWSSAWNISNAMGMSEKVLIAVDWAPPILVVEQPATNVISIPLECGCGVATLELSGTASDNVSGIEGVYIQAGDCAPFLKAEGTTNWNASVELEPGEHTITVYARDNAGFVSLMEEIVVTVEE